MSNIKEPNYSASDFAAFVAVDWADQQHAYSIQVAGQTKKQTGTLEQKPEVIGPWVAQLQERFKGQLVALAVEQSRGALIHALMNYDFIILYPLHPTTVARFREAFKFSGAKSDPLDTNQILEILTKHLDLLRPLKPDTEATRLLRRLVEDRRKTVDLRTKHLEALGASLKEYFPQAIELLSGNLDTRLAGDFLTKWPTFEAFQQAKPATLKQFFYGHNIRSSEVIQQALEFAKTARALTTDPAIVESGSRLSQMHSAVIQTLNPIIDEYEQRITVVFKDYPENDLFSNLPGAGDVMAPRLASFFGTDRSYYEAALNVQSFTGIAPVTIQSGRTKIVHARVACPHFDRQTFHEFARLSTAKCQWARNYVEYHRGRGKKYQVVVRALAYKWIRILFRCWQNRTPYDETKYMAILKKRGSIYATLHEKKIS